MRESIGALLRATRERRGLTIAQVSESIRVRSHYLQALENDDLSAMPSTAQARGFLRNYADYLGVQIDEVLPAAASPGQHSTVEGAEASAPSPAAEARAPERSLLRRFRDKASRKPDNTTPPEETTTREHPPGPAESGPRQESLAAAQQAAAPHLVGSESTATESDLESAEPPAAVSDSEDAASGAPMDSEGSAGLALGPPTTNPDAAQLGPPASGPGPLTAARTANGRTFLSTFLSRLTRRRNEDSAVVPEADQDSASSVLHEASSGPAPPAETPETELDVAGAEAAAESSVEVFADIGNQLKERREMLSLTYEEIERHTRVRASFLEALELGSLEELPSPVQTRGILANYAAFLDLDADSILLRFADGLQARHREQKPHWQPARTRPTMTVHTSLPPLRSFIASDLLFGVGIAIVLMLFAVWGITRVMAVRNASEVRATPPSISDVLSGAAAGSSAGEVTLIPAADTPLPPTVDPGAGAIIETLDPGVAVQVRLLTSERTYMRVTVDGEVKFEGRTEISKDYTYQAARQIEVLAGNGSALRVAFNGRDMGMMGSYGEVVDRIYTVQGVFTPTATPPPTPTASPNVTATPSTTPTVTPSSTVTPMPGG